MQHSHLNLKVTQKHRCLPEIRGILCLYHVYPASRHITWSHTMRRFKLFYQARVLNVMMATRNTRGQTPIPLTWFIWRLIVGYFLCLEANVICLGIFSPSWAITHRAGRTNIRAKNIHAFRALGLSVLKRLWNFFRGLTLTECRLFKIAWHL